jgi:DNA repair exonuclease SbcCD ATPase subunit
MEAERKAALLDKLKDSVADIGREVEMLEENLENKTPEAHRINNLVAETAKVKQDMEDKLFYQNQLQHMTRRLSKNQMSFDAYLAGMEEAYNACAKEYSEVKLLQRQLEAGHTETMFQLQVTPV